MDSEASSLALGYRFGAFELDPGRGELRREGEPVEIGRKAFDLLHYMALHPGDVLSGEEILARVWRVRSRSRSTVPTAIATLRHVLGDDARSPRYIETIPGRGYRFRGPVASASPIGAWSGREEAGFVGRRRELARLARATRAADVVRAPAILFYGEAGIGKTRLLDEFVHLARCEGVACAFARCREDEGAPALWPWIQLLRADAFSEEPALAGDAAALLRDLGVGPGDAGRAEPPRADGRFELFDSIASFLRRSARRRAIALVFDDLHRADLASLALLHQVVDQVRDGRVLVVGAFRDVGPDADRESAVHLRRLGRLEGVETQQLLPLSRADVERLLAVLHPSQGGPAGLVADLHERSGGNCFFLVQLIELLEARACLPAGSELPRGLRDLVLSQLEGIRPETAECLTVASVAGRGFATGLVADTLEVSETRVLRDLEPGLARRLVVADAERPDHFRFAHLLVRDALYAELGPERRAVLHLRMGEALARAHGDDPLAAAELAHHFFQAAHAGGARRAVVFAERAAIAAEERFAWEDVPRHYRRALAGLDLVDEAAPAERCELLLRLGESEIRAGRRPEGRSTLEAAANLAGASGASDLLARAALALAPGALSIEIGVHDPLLVSLLERALAALPDRDTPLRAQLLARLSLALQWGGAEARRRPLSEEALELAARSGDAATHADALMARYRTLAGSTELGERLATTAQFTAIGARVADANLPFMGRILHVTGLLEQGEIDSVDQEIRLFATELEARQLPAFRWYVPMFGAMRALMAGAFERSDRLAQEFRNAGARTGDENAFQSFGAHRAVLLWETGRAADGAAIIEGYLDELPNRHTWRSGLAFCLCDCGRPEDARRQVDRLAAQDFQEIPRNELWTATMTATSIAVAGIQDRPRAALLYDLLKGGAEQFAVLGYGVLFFGSISHYLGMLAATLERWDAAERHFVDALRLNERVEAWQWVAHTHLERARSLSCCGQAQDAVASASRAKDLAARLGLVTVEGKATRLLDSLRL